VVLLVQQDAGTPSTQLLHRKAIRTAECHALYVAYRLLHMQACDDGNLVAGDGCSGTCTVETGFACAGGNVTSKSTCDCAQYYLTPTADVTKKCSVFCNPAVTCSGHGTCSSSTGACLCDRFYGLYKNCASSKTAKQNNLVAITDVAVENSVLLASGDGVVIPAGALAAGQSISLDEWGVEQLDSTWTTALSASQVCTQSCGMPFCHACMPRCCSEERNG
jgi:cysteine-rich repeat protein